MDVHTISEESYKRGFERGYAEGICDHASDLLRGAVRWHRRLPDHDIPHCLVAIRGEGGEVRIYPGSFSELLQNFIAAGQGVAEPERVAMWGEIRPVTINPPNM